MPRKKAIEQEEFTENTKVSENTENAEAGENEEKKLSLGILKLDPEEIEVPEVKNDTTWSEISSAYHAKRIIPVVISGLEKTKVYGNVAIAYYREQRIVIPVSEMMITLNSVNYQNETMDERLTRICNSMLGAETDVIIKGIDKKALSVVASRKEAMIKKRERFYLTPLSDGLPHIREGRIAEGRIIAVSPMVARIELFGLEVTIPASQISWDWISDVSESFHVGETLNVLVTKVEGETPDNLKVEVDVKSITPNTSKDNLSKCVVQGKYIGEVTNVRNGTVFIRLKIGVNAISHTNYDKRMPGRGDIVSFVVTRINEDYGNVSGVLTRIIKQVI